MFEIFFLTEGVCILCCQRDEVVLVAEFVGEVN